MMIGGLQKVSLLDYPDQLSAIVWAMGCNFHCPFCYNVHLLNKTTSSIAEEEIIRFLEKRKGQLDGVVLTGGEPLLQPDLMSFAKKIKDRGYLLKVDTNGSFPEVLSDLIDEQLVDYVAMDVKAPQEKYPELTGIIPDLTAVQQSIELLLNGDVAYEFRTTVVPTFLGKEDIVAIAEWIEGASLYCLQQFKADTPLILDSLQQIQPYTEEELMDMVEEVKPFVQHVIVRGI